jgi:hypothetical protein
MSEQDCHTLFGKGDPGRSIEAKAETLELTKRLQLLSRRSKFGKKKSPLSNNPS